MSQTTTCGQGLATQSVLPATLARLTSSLADNLQAHLPALDRTDPKADAEHEVYRRLVAAYQDISERLDAAAKQMAGQRDLPMGGHDPAAMADPRIRRAFEAFLAIKQDLRALLDATDSRDEEILRSMPPAR
jgi:hypothetical protein